MAFVARVKDFTENGVNGGSARNNIVVDKQRQGISVVAKEGDSFHGEDLEGNFHLVGDLDDPD